MKNFWVLYGSQHGLWYHVGADGKLDTGFKYITDKTQNDGWFMLKTTNENGDMGSVMTGWQATGVAGDGWFQPEHNGHYGECTWTKSWGNYNPATGLWADGAAHH